MRSVLCTSRKKRDLKREEQGRRWGRSLWLKCCSVLCVVPCMCSQKPVGLTAPSQAPKVCDRYCHFGAGDSVVMRRRPSCIKVHSEVTHGYVIDKGVRQRHLESLGRPLTVLVDAHASQLAQIWVVEASLKHIEAVRFCTICREPKGFLVVQGTSMETVQWRKAVGVQAANLCRTAYCGYSVAQSCKDTKQLTTRSSHLFLFF